MGNLPILDAHPQWQAPSGLPHTSPTAIRPAGPSLSGQPLPPHGHRLRPSRGRACPLWIWRKRSRNNRRTVTGADASLAPRLIPLRQMKCVKCLRRGQRSQNALKPREHIARLRRMGNMPITSFTITPERWAYCPSYPTSPTTPAAASSAPGPCAIPSAVKPASITPSTPSTICAFTWPI